MEQLGLLVTCDYPGCTATVFRADTGILPTDEYKAIYHMFESMPNGWVAKDDRHLCPTHAQMYHSMIEGFWTGEPCMADELARDMEALPDDAILYTDMQEMITQDPEVDW